MALTQSERLSISKKIAEIPIQDAQADKIASQLGVALEAAQAEDDANKTLLDEATLLVNSYQTELDSYDGVNRTQVSEQDIIDSAKKVLQNPFFPNDSTVPLPSIPDGVWKNFVAFSGNKAIGKLYNETYASLVNYEDKILSDLNVVIGQIESLNDANRSTGKECVFPSCSIPGYTTPTDCTDNGGVWDAGGLQTFDDMVDYGNELKDLVQLWEDNLNISLNSIPSTSLDEDTTRVSLNQISKDDLNNALSIINTWQSLQDFDTSTSLPTGCTTFNTLPPSYFDPSKFRDVELQYIKDEITARLSYLVTRKSELNSGDYLGSISQNFTTGAINSAVGLFGKRFRLIDMRLNLMGGSLNKVYGIINGQKAQDELKKSNENAEVIYEELMLVSVFKAPAVGTKNIHVVSSTGFSVGDNVYIASNTQDELSVTIESISGNLIVLNQPIPKKYRHTELARLYKTL